MTLILHSALNRKRVCVCVWQMFDGQMFDGENLSFTFFNGAARFSSFFLLPESEAESLPVDLKVFDDKRRKHF